MLLHIFIRPAGSDAVPEAEKLRCNICDTAIEPAEAKDHAASKAHASKKSRLEEELKSTAGKKYAQDCSVVVQWTASVR